MGHNRRAFFRNRQIGFLSSSVSGGGYRKLTYETMFYHVLTKGNFEGTIKGFPLATGQWCQNLKLYAVKEANLQRKVLPDSSEQEDIRIPDGQRKLVYGAKDTSTKRSNKAGVVQYLGIAEDEPERLARLDGKTKISPLHLIGWTEADAKKWCIENDLLSPIYTDTCMRGGCWFCHNQRIQQLRELRHNYPNLWELLLKWDADSPVTFKADGHTVHDFDKRFQMEDEGLIDKDMRFKWAYMDEPPNIQIGFFGNEVFK